MKSDQFCGVNDQVQIMITKLKHKTVFLFSSSIKWIKFNLQRAIYAVLW